MHVVQHRVRSRRTMYLPYQRGMVDDVGLGGLDGSILQNISRVVGGIATTVGTGGLIWLAPKKIRASAERVTGALITSAGVGASIAPKAWGLSKSEANITRGITAAAVAVGGGIMLAPMMAGGTALTASAGSTAIGTASSGSSVIGAATGQAVGSSGTFLSTIGSGLKTIGSGLVTGIKTVGELLPVAGKLIGGGGGSGQPQQQQQQSGMTQAEFDAYQREAMRVGAEQQAEYERQQAYARQVELMQSQMYDPGAMYKTTGGMPPMGAYGDLRSPYTAITEDGSVLEIDPNTGNVVQPQAGFMGTGISTEVVVGGTILLAAAWFLLR